MAAKMLTKRATMKYDLVTVIIIEPLTCLTCFNIAESSRLARKRCGKPKYVHRLLTLLRGVLGFDTIALFTDIHREDFWGLYTFR